MTPTEQDKELETAICKVMNIFPEELEYNLPNSFGKRHLKDLMQLITADRERVALEARIDENNRYLKASTNGIAGDSEAVTFKGVIKFATERNRELRKQQEEV